MLEDAEINTILAALRYYQEKGQGNPSRRSDAIHDIAIGGDWENNTSLDADEIDILCEKINTGFKVASGWRCLSLARELIEIAEEHGNLPVTSDNYKNAIGIELSLVGGAVIINVEIEE